MTSHEKILSIVRRIPRGRVATYGQVAALAGLPTHARLVGYALAALPAATTVPWHRVINARGEISLRRGGADATVEQELRLAREGVQVVGIGRIDLARYRWTPRRREEKH